ncbi:MAG TPA: tetratricopeptide repeat protein [Candidatus Acidoferrales bacterium]|nr:tetratricopeptide repeat protein [Candidatus Acidoferrales bacterium]
MTRSEHPVPGDRRVVFGVCVFLAVVIFAVFGQALHFGFVNLDDDLYVTENPLVKAGLTAHGLAQVFTQPMCSFYHPFTMITLMLDAQIYGENAGGYHLTNLLIHAVTSIILFLALRQMTGTLWSSAFIATMFAVHPLHVESVAWVAERKDVMGGLFFALTLWAYVRYAQKPFSFVRYLAMLALFAVGLLCKPTIVTLPCVMLLLDFWPLNRMRGETSGVSFKAVRLLIVEKIPLFLMVVVACIMTIVAEGKTITPPGKLPLSLQLENVAVSYGTYFARTFWPAGLTPYYPYPQHGLPAWEIAGSLILLGVVSITALLLWRRRPYLLVGWLWYLGMLVPMIGLFQVGGFARADRFTYLPQIGLGLMIAFATADLTATWGGRRKILAGAMAVMVALLAVGSWRQTSFWRDSETLWRHTLDCNPENSFAHNSLGAALSLGGHPAEAIDQFQSALDLNPGLAEAHYNLAVALSAQNRTDEAVQSYQKAIALKPGYAEAENNLGILLAGQGHAEEAVQYFNKALADKPDYAEADNSLGIMSGSAGRLDEAVQFFQKAIAARPDYADAHFNLANAFALQGRTADAIRQYQETLRLNPNSVSAKEQLQLISTNRPSP